MRGRRGVSVCLLLSGLALLTGCGGEQPTLVPIKGRVFLDQEPLAFGTVMFQPRQGQSATGEIQSDGNFELSTYVPGDGVAPGMHKVRVTCFETQAPDASAPTASDEHALGRSLVPVRYTRFATSGIEVAVLASGNQPVILRLQSDPPEFGDDDAEHVDSADPDSEALNESLGEPATAEGEPSETPIESDEPPAEATEAKTETEPAGE